MAKCKRCRRSRRPTLAIEAAVQVVAVGLPPVEQLEARHEELFRRSFVLVAELSGVCPTCAEAQTQHLLQTSGAPGAVPGPAVPEVANG